MTGLDQQHISEWIGDAFAILCVRIGGMSSAEVNLRLGFETILRHLGTPPLRLLARTSPPGFGAINATTGDLRQILKALDACLAIYHRYDAVLTTTQRRIQILVRATRRFAEDALGEKRERATAPKVLPTAA
jgi:hypothetical protein